MSEPLISVVIPVYNGEPFLREALQSVAAQAGPALEIIVVDDGSQDASPQIVQIFAKETGIPVQYIYQENQGPAAARNRGLERAGGDLLAFIDADDLWGEQRLTIQIALLAANPQAWLAWGRVQVFEMENGMRVDKGIPRHAPNIGSALYRRAAFDQVGRFDETLRLGEDLDWFARAIEINLERVIHPEIALWYRQHASNTWLGRPDPHRAMLAVLKNRLDRRRAE